jgi:hypothetical protein
MDDKSSRNTAKDSTGTEANKNWSPAEDLPTAESNNENTPVLDESGMSSGMGSDDSAFDDGTVDENYTRPDRRTPE